MVAKHHQTANPNNWDVEQIRDTVADIRELALVKI